jgi:LysM repeat protein
MQDAAVKGRTLAGDRHWSRRMPERLARGDAHPSRVHPERVARGLQSGVHTHPERYPRGEAKPNTKLTNVQVIEMRHERQAGMTLKALAHRYGVGISTIHRIVTGQTWQSITSPAIRTSVP